MDNKRNKEQNAECSADENTVIYREEMTKIFRVEFQSEGKEAYTMCEIVNTAMRALRCYDEVYYPTKTAPLRCSRQIESIPITRDQLYFDRCGFAWEFSFLDHFDQRINYITDVEGNILVENEGGDTITDIKINSQTEEI